MYSPKEKIKAYNDLSNPDYFEADYALLRKVSPTSPLINTARRNPRRYYKEVLYEVLNNSTREEIRQNRRQYNNQKNEPDETTNPSGLSLNGTDTTEQSGDDDTSGGNTGEAESNKDKNPGEDSKESDQPSGTGITTAPGTAADKASTSQLNPFEIEAQTFEKQAEAVEQKKDEKKSLDPAEAPSSKKKTSTQTSTGETSKTKTYKSQP